MDENTEPQHSEASPQHTPGPWRWGGYVDQPVLWSLTHGRSIVMSFARLGMQGAQPVFFRRGPNDNPMAAGDYSPAKDIAVREVPYRDDIVALDNPDARLIAAAPDLLAALKSLLASVDATEDEDWSLISVTRLMVESLDELVAKAEGRDAE